MDMVFITDCRVRFWWSGLLVGDRVPLRDGGEGVVYAKRSVGSREHLVVVPTESVSEEWTTRMYRGEFQTDDDFPAWVIAS
jgi:hypothetical protein